MELNGIANIAIILKMAEIDGKITPDIAEKIIAQLTLLDRYMASANNERLPFWHEIIANPEKFPTLYEKINGHLGKK